MAKNKNKYVLKSGTDLRYQWCKYLFPSPYSFQLCILSNVSQLFDKVLIPKMF